MSPNVTWTKSPERTRTFWTQALLHPLLRKAQRMAMGQRQRLDEDQPKIAAGHHRLVNPDNAQSLRSIREVAPMREKPSLIYIFSK